jgi:hypothetical protein
MVATSDHTPGTPTTGAISRAVTAATSAPRYLVDPSMMHDACGTGFVAQIDGAKAHRVVKLGWGRRPRRHCRASSSCC